jgi:benzoate 4-monooxygenase
MITDFILTPWPFLILGAAYWLIPYFFANKALRRIPAPFPASFTNLWLLYQVRRQRRYRAVDEAHRRLGPVVRIQPDHVSLADANAIHVVYGHGNGLLKRLAMISVNISTD